MKPINVGLLGIGTVGSGTFKVLQRNSEEISQPRRLLDPHDSCCRQGYRSRKIHRR